MGLAPYGEPVYADLIREKLIDLKEDGSFRMDMSYFQLLPGAGDDLAEVRAAVWRAAATRRGPADPAGNGHGRLDPAGDRRDHAPRRAALARTDRHEESLPGRRRGAELRRQRANPAGRPF